MPLDSGFRRDLPRLPPWRRASQAVPTSELLTAKCLGGWKEGQGSGQPPLGIHLQDLRGHFCHTSHHPHGPGHFASCAHFSTGALQLRWDSFLNVKWKFLRRGSHRGHLLFGFEPHPGLDEALVSVSKLPRNGAKSLASVWSWSQNFDQMKSQSRNVKNSRLFVDFSQILRLFLPYLSHFFKTWRCKFRIEFIKTESKALVKNLFL